MTLPTGSAPQSRSHRPQRHRRSAKIPRNTRRSTELDRVAQRPDEHKAKAERRFVPEPKPIKSPVERTKVLDQNGEARYVTISEALVAYYLRSGRFEFSYETRTFHVPSGDGRIRKFRPDFYVEPEADELGVYLEVTDGREGGRAEGRRRRKVAYVEDTYGVIVILIDSQTIQRLKLTEVTIAQLILEAFERKADRSEAARYAA